VIAEEPLEEYHAVFCSRLEYFSKKKLDFLDLIFPSIYYDWSLISSLLFFISLQSDFILFLKKMYLFGCYKFKPLLLFFIPIF
jgi:hypothetical protein